MRTDEATDSPLFEQGAAELVPQSLGCGTGCGPISRSPFALYRAAVRVAQLTTSPHDVSAHGQLRDAEGAEVGGGARGRGIGGLWAVGEWDRGVMRGELSMATKKKGCRLGGNQADGDGGDGRRPMWMAPS